MRQRGPRDLRTSFLVRPEVVAAISLILAPATVFLAASFFGPVAAAIVSGAWAVLGGLAQSFAVDRVRKKVERFRRLAYVDDLTGLANDRGFRERLSSEPILALALIDVDQFKAYNDAFGHSAGDEALKSIGRLLSEVGVGPVRVHRIGGDEFAVMIVGNQGADLAVVAESLRRVVEDHRWPLRPITVSMGMARSLEEGPPGLFDRADRRLYRAKHAGGNRLIVQD